MTPNPTRAAILRLASRHVRFGEAVITKAVMRAKISNVRTRLNALRWFWNLYPEGGPFYMDPNHAPIALALAAEVAKRGDF